MGFQRLNMGSAPTVNIEVMCEFDEATDIVEELVDWLGYEVKIGYTDGEYLEYDLYWPEPLDGGQQLKIRWFDGQNPVFGCTSNESLVVHYSPRRSEGSIVSFSERLDVMMDILEWMEERFSDDRIKHYVSVSTT